MQVDVWIDGQPDKGHLSCPITVSQQIYAIWPLGLKGQDDESWDWPAILIDCPNGQIWTQFQLVAADLPQGAMVLLREREMRAAENADTLGIYIEYLATAPWNRKNEQGQRIDTRHSRVAPVGRRLVEVAIELSTQLGFEGRMGWHSKPGAESWYKNTLPGLVDTGVDEEDENGLHYFEISPEVAEAFKVGGVHR